MNTTIFWRLVWKEYRVQLGFWYAMAVLTVTVQLIVLQNAAPADRTTWLFGTALIVTAFYALGCGATLFATEHETGTFDFQRALPVSNRLLFTAKTVLGVSSVLAFSGLLWLVAALMAGWERPPAEHLRGMWGVWGFAAVELFAWGLFFSLLLRGPLKAAIFAVSAASLCAHVAAAGPAPYMAEKAYLDALPLRAAIVALVGLADLWLGLRWFQCPGLSLGWLRPSDRRMAEEPQAASDRFRPSRSMILERLLWQQWRQSGLLMLGVTMLAGLWLWPQLYGFSRSTPPDLAREMTIVICAVVAIVPAILGVTVFLADQQHRFRFFAEHGISPRYVWLSRQLSWIALILAGAVVLLVAWALKPLPHAALVLGVTVVACTCGQLCSMFLRSGILAGIAAVVLAVPAATWAGLMSYYQFNWLWSVLPLPLALLWATWLRAPAWIVERNHWRAWLWPALPPVIAAVALVTTVAYLRIHEIERWPDPGFSLAELDQPATKEAIATGAMYQRALALLTRPKHPAKADETEEAATPEAIREANAAWLAANQEALALALEASLRKECDSQCSVRSDRMLNACDLARLVTLSGEQLEVAGDLDGALDRYAAALRMAQHARQRARHPDLADGIESDVWEHLVRWAAQPQQTPKRLLAAMRRVEEITTALPSTDLTIKTRYREDRERITSGVAGLGRLQGTSQSPFSQALWLLLPWEKARALRALDQLTADELFRLHKVEDAVASRRPVGQDMLLYRRNDWRVETTPSLRIWYCPEATWLIHSLIRTETARRAMRLQLALAAWKLERGELPRSLDELVGRNLDRIPLDPHTAEPFRYFPDGVPIPFYWHGQKSPADPRLEAKQPFLWATGTDVFVQYSESTPRERCLIRQGRDDWRSPTSEYDVWESGWIYPVP